MSVSISKVVLGLILKHTGIHSLYIICGHFHSNMALLITCDKDVRSAKLKIFTIWPCTEENFYSIKESGFFYFVALPSSTCISISWLEMAAKVPATVSAFQAVQKGQKRVQFFPVRKLLRIALFISALSSQKLFSSPHLAIKHYSNML